jgi:hypothetical protein
MDTELKDGQQIWILTSDYSHPEAEYGVEYIVGMFLSSQEAEDKAKELELGSYGLRSFTWGSITVREDVR